MGVAESLVRWILAEWAVWIVIFVGGFHIVSAMLQKNMTRAAILLGCTVVAVYFITNPEIVITLANQLASVVKF